MTAIDLSTWLPMAEAMAAIGVSKRTVERLARDQKLEKRLRPQDGSPPVLVFSPESVAEVAAARRREAAPFVLPAVGTGNGNGQGLKKSGDAMQLVNSQLQTPATEDLFRQVLTLAIQAIQSPPSPPVAETVTKTLYLTIAEAAAYANLPAVDLRRACESGELKARKTGRGGWRIRRTDLEAL